MEATMFLKKALRRIIRSFYCSVEHTIATLPVDDFHLPDRMKKILERVSSHNFTYCRIQEKDIHLIRREYGDAVGKRSRERLKDSLGILVFNAGIPAGYGWSSSELRKHEGEWPLFYDIHPMSETVLLYDGYVAPDQRGKGVIALFTSVLIEEAKKTGAKEVFMIFDSMNSSMFGVARRFGFEITGTIRYQRRFWHTLRDISDLTRVCRNIPS